MNSPATHVAATAIAKIHGEEPNQRALVDRVRIDSNVVDVSPAVPVPVPAIVLDRDGMERLVRSSRVVADGARCLNILEVLSTCVAWRMACAAWAKIART